MGLYGMDVKCCHTPIGKRVELANTRVEPHRKTKVSEGIHWIPVRNVLFLLPFNPFQSVIQSNKVSGACALVSKAAGVQGSAVEILVELLALRV